MIALLSVFVTLFALSCQQQQTYGSSSYSSSGTSSDSSNVPGYLPDYQGDKYTNKQRILDTQALNKAFFDNLGYTPSPPPETPAQQGTSSNSTAIGTSNYGYSNGGYGSSYSNTNAASSTSDYNTLQYSQGLTNTNSQSQYGGINIYPPQSSFTTVNPKFTTQGQIYEVVNTTPMSSQNYDVSSSTGCTTCNGISNSYSGGAQYDDTYSSSSGTSTQPSQSDDVIFQTQSVPTGQQYDSSNLQYQNVDSSQYFNDVLGVNAGYPVTSGSSSSSGGSTSSYSTGGSTSSYSTGGSTSGYSTGGSTSGYSTAAYYSASTSYPYSTSSYGSSTPSQVFYDSVSSTPYTSSGVSTYTSSSPYGSTGVYSDAAGSCCSSTSTSCCYQTSAGYGINSNLYYNPSMSSTSG